MGVSTIFYYLMENNYIKNIVTFRTIFYKFLLMFTNVLINYLTFF